MDATCTIQDSIHVFSLVHKYVSRILGTYQGAKAFYGCKKLRTVVIKNTQMTGKTVGSGAFTGTYAKMTVKVPLKKLKSYKTILLKRGVSKKAVIKK